MADFFTIIAGLCLILGLVGFLIFFTWVVVETIKKDGDFKKPGKYALMSLGFVPIAIVAGIISDELEPEKNSNISIAENEKEIIEVNGQEDTNEEDTLTYEAISGDSINSTGLLFKKGTFSGTIKDIERIEAPNDNRSVTDLLIWQDNKSTQPISASLIDQEKQFSIGENVTFYGAYTGKKNIEYNGSYLVDVPEIIINSFE